MAEPISIQQLKDASLDVKSLEEVVNGDENVVVTTRLGETYPSVKGSIKKVFENGGLPAAPFATKALMTASALVDGDYAMVTDDTNNNGLYVKTEGAWVKSAYDPLAQAKADATTKANAAEANAKNYADALDSKIGYYQTENLVNPNQETAVGYYANGVPNGNASYISALDYYAVQPNQKIWTRGIFGGAVIAVYDSAKVYIGNINPNIAVNGVITIAATYGTNKVPAFIRLSSLATTISGFGFGYGHIRPPKVLAYQEKYSVVNNKNFSEAVGEDIFKKDNDTLKNVINVHNFDLYNNHLVLFKNLVNPNQELIQGYYTGVGITTPYLGLPNYYVTTEFIPVPLNRKFWIIGAGTGYLLQLCDADKNPVFAPNLSNVVGNKYTAPLTAGEDNTPIHYIRVGSSRGIEHIRNNGLGVGWANDAFDIPSEIPPYGSSDAKLSQGVIDGISDTVALTESSLHGKNWVAMGDSITSAANCYADVLAARHGATLTKKAVGGGRVHRESVDSPHFVMSEGYLDIPLLPAPDLITIAGGTNDPLTVADVDHLGVMSDRTINTFYGALHVLIAGLRDRFPDARLGFIAPIPKNYGRYDSNDPNNSYYQKYKAIKDVCEYYAINYWNGSTEFGAHPLDSSVWKDKYMTDGLHPSSDGHVWYANRVENFILNLAK